MFRLAQTLVAAVIGLLVCGAVSAADSDEGRALKESAVERLARSLDPAVPVAVGKAVVRQAALIRARELLASHGRRAGLDEGWNRAAPEWARAEAELMQDVAALIASRIQTPDWFYHVLKREIARTLNAEEADYIATHFTTWAGNEQRILLQMRLIAEVLMANYTFTNRIDHTVSGLESDLNELSHAYWELEPFRKRDFMNDQQAMKFAGQAAGLKFTRMLAIRGIEGFAAHIDAMSAEARTMVDNAEVLIEEHVVAYRRRVGGGD